MEYHAFVARGREGAALAEAKDFSGAARVFQNLAEQDLPAMDRAAMYLNAAVCLGQTDQAAEAGPLYDAGIAIERPLFRGLVRAGKADWLTKQGRSGEAAEVYADLLDEQWLTATERRRYEDLRFRARP